MDGGRWGEVIRVHVARDGNIWVFHRCFNTVPPGHATCIRRGDANPPILEFDPSGKLLKSFGAGLFAYPHGFTIDGDGNLWISDVNDEATVLGMSARNADGVVMGQEVLKLSPAGKVLMMIGKEGVAGNGTGYLRSADRRRHRARTATSSWRTAIAQQVRTGAHRQILQGWPLHQDPGDTKDRRPASSTSRTTFSSAARSSRVYVADRENNRIQVFDQDGNFIAAWQQFGQPSSVFVGKDDTIYVGASFRDPAAKKGELSGIVVGNAKDGSLKAFIPDPADLDKAGCRERRRPALRRTTRAISMRQTSARTICAST